MQIDEYKFPDGFYPGKTIGEVLLTPTKIYVNEVVELLKIVKVHGLAHITGGGLRNLPRLNKNVKFKIEELFEPQPIFQFLQKKMRFFSFFSPKMVNT